MGEFVIKMPDVGEGVAEAELVEWHVKPGDPVREDMILAAVMTDKATVEIPSPVNGTVLWLGAEIGDTVAVKAPLVRIEIAGEGAEAPAAEEKPAAKVEEKPAPGPKPLLLRRASRQGSKRRLRQRQQRQPGTACMSRPSVWKRHWRRRPCACALAKAASTCAR